MTEIEFTAIVGRTKKTVLSAVRKHLAARFFHAIDDVVQETYLRGYRHLAGGKFRNESSLETWLYAIARNESLRMNNRLAREEAKAVKEADRWMSLETERASSDEVISLGLLLERLPAKYREVVTLKSEGYTEQEI
ncbi:MAG: sigma-70 family RNA polymerase sigma factor, partial [Spirochaetes bacterium]|nr:sigma-70 family RNA polymerase sigma factor [Spirochaetota bacterium]